MPHMYDTIQPYQSPVTSHVPHQHLLNTIQHCEATCEQMISILVNYPDLHARTEQAQLLRDCADICTLMSKFLARNTHLAKSLARYCAYVCELCGNTCLQFPDSHSQHCGQTCLNCAQECRRFSM